MTEGHATIIVAMATLLDIIVLDHQTEGRLMLTTLICMIRHHGIAIDNALVKIIGQITTMIIIHCIVGNMITATVTIMRMDHIVPRTIMRMDHIVPHTIVMVVPIRGLIINHRGNNRIILGRVQHHTVIQNPPIIYSRVNLHLNNTKKKLKSVRARLHPP